VTVRGLFRDGLQGGLRRVGYQITRAPSDPTYVPNPPNTYPTYSPSQEPAFQERFARFAERTLTRPDRAYVLQQCARQAMHLPGDFAEAGVFRGGTAWFLADLLAERGDQRPLHLFDSFAGMPADADPLRDGHAGGDFGDTSLEAVRALLAPYPNAVFHPGFLPATFAGLEDRRFAFVHVDVDIHAAVRDAIAFFYPRLVPGGVLLFDDYGFEIYKRAARKAVDDAFADKPEQPLVLRTGQCLVTRLPA